MAVGDFTTYSYTGAVQTATLLAGKRYKFECWGAQGGSASGSLIGGKGGYVVGEYIPSVNTDINIYVGQQPTNNSGGWNGGGNGYRGGGGASDIRVGGTALTDRILVAAGGGGCGEISGWYGGFGGGLYGGDGYQYSPYIQGFGGTQTAGGSSGGALGTGGNAVDSRGGGGGGGYYGGGGATGRYCGGGGGSSYHGNNVINAYTFANVQTGNGSVVITEISNVATTLLIPTTFSYTGGVQDVFLNKGSYTVELYGGSGGNYSSFIGGKGGYCKADIVLTTNTKILMFVGGSASGATGGWNGGGNSNSTGGGGGASDIRIQNGELTDRIIVAAGGGGAGSNKGGGGGGGFTGENGKDLSGAGTGGTQTAGGSSGGTLGLGGVSINSAGGGGGGYYGGGVGTNSTAGGGGSSYYGELENAETVTGVNEGNGYIVITPLAKPYNGFPQII